MAFETIEELTWAFINQDGETVRRQLDKQVLSNKGGWVSVIYLYQDRRPDNHGKGSPADGPWLPPQAVFVRYKRVKGALRMKKQTSIAMTYASLMGTTLMLWDRALHDRLPLERCNVCGVLYVDGQGSCRCEPELKLTGTG
jgi:hypothetical protein